MPFVSEAQRRKFYATPSLRKYIPEYEAATRGRRLPQHVGPKKYRGRSVLNELSKHHHKRKRRHR